MALMETHYYSFSMRSNVTMNVFIPTPGSDGSITQMNSTEKYDYVKGIPVVYLLHGAYGDAFSWIRYSNIDRYAQDRGIAVVMASAENSFYQDLKGGNAYYTFFTEELPKFIQNVFPVSRDREKTYVAGFSMGGYGALLNGLRYRKVFSRIAALSPAADPGELFSHAREGGFGPDEFANLFGSLEAYENGPWNLRKIYPETNPAEIPELFVGCGDHDIAVWRQVKDFLQALDQAGIPCRRWQNHGNHDIDTWEAMMDPAFSFLAGIPEGTRNSLAIPEAASARDAVVQ